jgi:hypothetical protein
MKRKALAIVLSALTVNLLLFSNWKESHFILPLFGTLGFASIVILANAIIHLLHSWQINENRKLAIVSSLVAITFSVVALFRGSGFDTFIISVGSFFGTCLALLLVIAEKLNLESWLDIIASPFLLAKGWIEGAFKAISHIPKLKRIGNTEPIILGLIIGAPIIFILTILLSSADPIFGSVVKNIFDIHLPTTIISRTLATLFALSFVIPFFYSHVVEKNYDLQESGKLAGRMTTTAITVILPVAVLLGAFLLIQSHYLFASVSETELHRFGVQTYSEYVRKGFGELVLVSIISFATAAGALYVFSHSKDRLQKALQWINFILLGELVVFIFSVFRRVYLYQLLHGLTRARVYGLGVLILMLVLIGILYLRHIKPKVNWLRVELAVLALFILTLSSLGVDRLIAESAPPTVNNEIDYVYIARLSTDAFDSWDRAYTHAKKEVDVLSQTPIETNDQKRRLIYALWTLNALVDHYVDINNKGEINDPRYFSIAKWNARNRYNTQMNYGEIVATQQKANDLYASFSYEPIYNIIDRSFDTPLLY